MGDRNHDCNRNRGGGGNLSGDDGDGDMGGDNDDRYTCTSMYGLRCKLHEFFRRLKRSTYLLLASLPTFNNRNILGGDKDDVPSSQGGRMWRLKSDINIQRTFAPADEFFLKRCRLANATSSG